MFLFEYCQNGDLFEFITKMALNRDQEKNHLLIRTIFTGLIECLNYLHNNCGVTLNNISLEKVLLSNEFQPIIYDFSFASSDNMKNENYSSFIDSSIRNKYFLAPEILVNCKSIDLEKALVFRLGVMLFTALFNRPPF